MEGAAPDAPVELDAQVRQRTLEQLPSSHHVCVICLDPIHEPCEAEPCHHTNFDYLCLLEWLSRTPRCPLCVQPVAGIKHHVDGNEVTTPVPSPAKTEHKPAPAPTPTQNELFLDPFRLRNARRRNRPRSRRPCGQAAGADLGIDGRRRVYQQGLFSKHVGSNRMSQYRELTPALFNSDSQLVSRARMFLRRELQVFPFLAGEESHAAAAAAADATATHTSVGRRRADNAEFLLEYIIAVLKSVDIVGGRAEDLVAEFLGREHTRLFLHELRAWLRSPYERLEDWDRMVQYAAPSSSSPSTGSRASSAASGPARREWRRPRGDSWRPSASARSSDDRRKGNSRDRRRSGLQS